MPGGSLGGLWKKTEKNTKSPCDFRDQTEVTTHKTQAHKPVDV